MAFESKITKGDSAILSFSYLDKLSLKMVIKGENIISYRLTDKDKSLDMKTKYYFVPNKGTDSSAKCLQKAYLDKNNKIILTKYFCDCDEYIVERDLNYSIPLSDSQTIEIDYFVIENDTVTKQPENKIIRITLLNKDNFWRFGYFINLTKKTYSFGSYRRITRKYYLPDKNGQGIGIIKIIQDSAERYGIWQTNDFNNNILEQNKSNDKNIINVQ